MAPLVFLADPTCTLCAGGGMLAVVLKMVIMAFPPAVLRLYFT